MAVEGESLALQEDFEYFVEVLWFGFEYLVF